MKRKEFLEEIRRLSVSELNEKAMIIAEELMKLRIRKRAGLTEGLARVVKARKELAQVLTLQRKLQLAESK